MGYGPDSVRLKVGVVLGGYLAAFVLASIAVAIRTAGASGPDAQASSGMYAFGDTVLFAAIFGTAGLLPTGLGLVFLRPYRRFWIVLSVVVAVVALTGVAAITLFAIGRAEPTTSALGAWAAFSVLRILPTPLLAAAFLLAGVVSPHRASRWTLSAASAIECVIFGCALFVWVNPFRLP